MTNLFIAMGIFFMLSGLLQLSLILQKEKWAVLLNRWWNK